MVVTYVRRGTVPGEIRAILITPDFKVRQFDNGTPNGRDDRQWILFRGADSTDEDWYAAPWENCERREEFPQCTQRRAGEAPENPPHGPVSERFMRHHYGAKR